MKLGAISLFPGNEHSRLVISDKERKALKKLIDESLKILREVMEDESSQGKMFKHLLDIDILDAIASYIYKYQTELKQYDKNRKNRQKLKRKKVKGFAKIN